MISQSCWEGPETKQIRRASFPTSQSHILILVALRLSLMSLPTIIVASTLLLQTTNYHPTMEDVLLLECAHNLQ